MKNVLSIAGSDSCGGAGIQADLKTFSALGTYGMTVITAVTAQNTTGVFKVHELDADMVREQIDCLFADIPISAVKIGMVSRIEVIKTIAECLQKNQAANIVLDPVMISKSGYHLLRPEAKGALVKFLFPIADTVTPNLFEAEAITGNKISNIDEMKKAAIIIHEMGARSVVVLGVMSLLGSVLTLPGIAGFALSIGMAVDANIIIYERIKEELRLGKTLQASIHAGFKRAFWTIFDANLTTLITALVLMYFGTGPIKGFAVTLSIGIIASMLIALIFTRYILILFANITRNHKLYGV